MSTGTGMDEKPTSPFRRQARNVWVMAARGTGLPDDADHKKRVLGVLDQVIRSFQHVALQQGAQLRLITGAAADIDASSAEIAKKYGCERHVLAPSWVESGLPPDRVALLMENTCASPDTAADAADEAKLGYADAMVVLCHGAPLSDYSAERDGILVEAICRHMPIVWIDMSAEDAGGIHILRPRGLDEWAVTTLGKDEEQVRRIADDFVDQVEPAALGARMEERLSVYWNLEKTAAIDAMLRLRYGDPGRRATWHGMFYTLFLTLFGNWKVKFLSPVQEQRGPAKLVEQSRLRAATWEWFDRIDRAATYAAYSHRDQVVVVNLAASLAVFAAVAGQVWLSWTAWPLLELLLVALIGLTVYGNRHRQMTNHDRWVHFRQSAEALRLSALLHPLLASLPLLHRGVWKYDATHRPQPVLDKPFHWLVIQLLRDAGIPGEEGRHCVKTRFPDLVDSLDALIEDQKTYHQRSRGRYEQTHHRLRDAIACVFCVVVLWVGFHMIMEYCHAPPGILRPNCALLPTDMLHGARWPLFLTAFLPALAAAMHGIASKAELQRLAKNSGRMCQRLDMLQRLIQGVRGSGDPLALRALAVQAAATMYAEHDAWAELMADQPLELV